MTARAFLPSPAESAITTLFEKAINETRLFWSQRPDGSLLCADWEWCCPEVPAILAGMDAVVFITREPSTVRLAAPDVLVVALQEARVWGKWRVLKRPPTSGEAVTWDDRIEVSL